MFYEERTDVFGIIWSRTHPRGPWSIVIPAAVQQDINIRWEQDYDHHPKSEALLGIIGYLDVKFCGEYFDWKTGGDGDNGETLMFLFDILFEAQDLLCKR